jgi:hypothetical protein
MTIALLLALTPLASVTYEPFLALGIDRAWSEVARSVIIVLLMVWSVGAIGIHNPQTSTAESLATA